MSNRRSKNTRGSIKFILISLDHTQDQSYE
ncbi:MAG: hypothetical protein RIR83_1705, partial [Pseudomonadota bacterium]